MRKVLVGCVTFGVMLCTALGITRAGLFAKPKHDIKEVMAQAHKSKLVNKVQDGGASKEEKEKLLTLYVDLYDNKPPKGDAASWSQKTGALVVASAKALLGTEGATESLKTAANCAACHKEHKPN